MLRNLTSTRLSAVAVAQGSTASYYTHGLRYPLVPTRAQMIRLEKDDMAAGLHSYDCGGHGHGAGTYLVNFCDRIVWSMSEVRLHGATDDPTVITMINEMPKNTAVKFEVSKTEVYNPIVQEVDSHGHGRVLKAGPIGWNYGTAPQTYASDKVLSYESNVVGDGDGLDVIDIGGKRLGTGEVAQVKILGALGLVDQGQSDWKVIAVNVADPLAASYKTIKDVPASQLEAIRSFYETYKVAEGKAKNTFLFGGEVKDQAFAVKLVHHHNVEFENMLKDSWAADHAEFRAQIHQDMGFEFSDNHGLAAKPYGPGTVWWPAPGARHH